MTDRVLTLGILGAGQLASMLTVAANRVGVEVHVYRPSASADRCSANRVTTASLDDLDAVAAWGREVDVVTVETENIPLATLQAAATSAPVYPPARSVEICQDRLVEKDFLTGNGVATARYVNVSKPGDPSSAMAELGTDAILKTRRFGYDGKGQHRVSTETEAEAAWQGQGEVPCVLEELVAFDAEISVIAARSADGEVAIYDPGHNTHRDGILRTTRVPSQLSAEVERAAVDIAKRIVELQDYVGVIGIEFFVLRDQLLVNEMAPRVHNSGHWTMDGCAVDQFEQHVRAVMGLPLGSTLRHSDIEMRNLIGHDIDQLPALLAAPNQRIHLYGKREIRPGRKMGHVNQFPSTI